MRMTSHIHSDRGVASTILVLFLSAALGLTAIVVDVGNSWQERRHLVTATDAAALAAVQDYVRDDLGCALSAPTFVTANNPDATMTSCVHVPPTAGSPGRVTVEAEATVDFIFANVLGIADATVSSSTSASYDLASRIDGGLRPFGLCADALAHLDPPMVPGNEVKYTIYYSKGDQTDSCGGDVPGNWGLMNFNGGPAPSTELEDWTENGYDGSVAIGDWVGGNTGSFSQPLDQELQMILYPNVDYFTLPLFSITNGEVGINAKFLIDSFVSVRLWSFDVGSSNGPEGEKFLELEFLNEVEQGTGGGTGAGLGAYVIGICAVDGVDPAAACGN
jgi:hypothetical protein